MEESVKENEPKSDGQPAQPVVHLSVLPHSGKVEELRRQAEADRPPTGAPVASTVPSEGTPGSASASATPAAEPAPAAVKTISQKLLEGQVIAALRQIYDPELPVNIYDLGLIYEIDAAPDNSVKVKMTLTAPACPVAGSLPGEVERRIEAIPDVKSADVELVWEPQWSRDRMSEAAQLELGLF